MIEHARTNYGPLVLAYIALRSMRFDFIPASLWAAYVASRSPAASPPAGRTTAGIDAMSAPLTLYGDPDE